MFLTLHYYDYHFKRSKTCGNGISLLRKSVFRRKEKNPSIANYVPAKMDPFLKYNYFLVSCDFVLEGFNAIRRSS